MTVVLSRNCESEPELCGPQFRLRFTVNVILRGFWEKDEVLRNKTQKNQGKSALFLCESKDEDRVTYPGEKKNGSKRSI